MLLQLLQSIILASTKQLPTKTDQCSDQKLYLQQPVGRRKNSCSFNYFNPQYLRRPNSYQQKQISVLISNYTCSNQLVDAETVVRSTASIHNTYVDQTIAGKLGSVFRSTGVLVGTVLSTHKHLLVQLVRCKVSIMAVCRRLIVKAWLLSRKKSIQLAIAVN